MAIGFILFILTCCFVFYFKNRKTINRDLRYVYKYTIILAKMWFIERNNQTVPKLFQKNAKKHPHKIALYYENETWTFREVERYSNKVANFFKQKGYERGDTVALFLEARPEYICIWLGLSKIGVITALINSNLVGDALSHCIETAKCKSLILGSSLAPAIESVSSNLSNIKLYEFVEDEFVDLDDCQNFSAALESSSPVYDVEKSFGKMTDVLLYIYSSGTTGLPKAAIITNKRYVYVCVAFRIMMDLKDDDVAYNCLPLYHTSGGLLGVGPCIVNGISVAIRKKFSATHFWPDCIRYKCTIVNYIGEICRYVLAAHKSNPQPVKHFVTKCVGSGLQLQIWKEFVSVFSIGQVFELYGSTEGNANLVNIDNKLGSVGYYPSWASFIYKIILIKCDLETGEPLRDPNGYCQQCQRGEPGLFIGKVDRKKALSDFRGYADRKATEKKILRNVLERGDLFFNTGDILVQDQEGYYYFQDRIGDTFRWKGENVATAEVQILISNCVNLADVIVYGVDVPNVEGKAGMAAIVDADRSVDIDKLCQSLKENLPFYAIPLFIRIMDALPLTGTFKLTKTSFQKDGFNVDLIQDKIFFFDAKKAAYEELTRGKYEDIVSGKIRF